MDQPCAVGIPDEEVHCWAEFADVGRPLKLCWLYLGIQLCGTAEPKDTGGTIWCGPSMWNFPRHRR